MRQSECIMIANPDIAIRRRCDGSQMIVQQSMLRRKSHPPSVVIARQTVDARKPYSPLDVFDHLTKRLVVGEGGNSLPKDHRDAIAGSRCAPVHPAHCRYP